MHVHELLIAVLYGVVEGITEWLPISSTGHMLLLAELLPLPVSEEFFSLFSVVIQLGAVLAVALRFFGQLNPFHRDRARAARAIHLLCLTAIGVLPSCILGFFLDTPLERFFFNPRTVALMLVGWGLLFLLAETPPRRLPDRKDALSDLSVRDALSVGCFQLFALIPGTSRSGATVLGGRLTGLSGRLSTEFSFLLSLPTMLGAGILRTARYALGGYSPTLRELLILLVGSLVSFLVSLLVTKRLTGFLQSHCLSSFGPYRILLGGAVLAYDIFR